MTRRVLVTGVSGFIGSALVRTLAGAGYFAQAAARNPSNIPRAVGIESASLPDLSGAVNWKPLVTEVDVVVHLAGIAHRSGIVEGAYDRIIRIATSTLSQACL